MDKRFADGTVALGGMELEVRRGEFLSLLGPSGCGKSTVLRLIAGLGEPSAGTMQRGAVRLGFVFQEPTLMPWRTVSANVRLPLQVAGLSRREAEPRVAEALGRVGLALLLRFAFGPRALRPAALSRVALGRGRLGRLRRQCHDLDGQFHLARGHGVAKAQQVDEGGREAGMDQRRRGQRPRTPAKPLGPGQERRLLQDVARREVEARRGVVQGLEVPGIL